MKMPIEHVHIPHFYRDRLLRVRWKRIGDMYSCYITMRARKRFRMVPLDDAQKQEVTEVLRSFEFSRWTIERQIWGGMITACGYRVYVPAEEFERRHPFPSRFPEDIIRLIQSFGNTRTLLM